MNHFMNLSDFIQKFLPDYRNRLWSAIHNEEISEIQFEQKSFPEALENFLLIACRQQRDNCFNVAKSEIVLNAKQPIIDELTNSL